MPDTRRRVWWYALGYFACYVPYSGLTKILSDGRLGARISGLSLLPLTTISSAFAMFATISALGWWKYASRAHIGRIAIAAPTRWTFLSGVATSMIVVSTTLAYTFANVSIPLVMLLMRGGVLLLAPVVDALNGRHVARASRIALVLSLVAMGDTVLGIRDGHVPWLCGVDIAIYLFAYFARLRFMSHLAKTRDDAQMKRYFVEEQMVATPVAVVLIAAIAIFGGQTHLSVELARGYDVLSHPALGWVLLVGVLSQGTGVFGGLLLLDARENSFCVPLNRSSSVLAGIAASIALALIVGSALPTVYELVGAALLVVAMIVLWAAPDHPPASLPPAGPRTAA